MKGIEFREILLRQIKEYLDGKITKEQYYAMAEPFYSKYANTYKNLPFHKCFLELVADACLFYIDEPDSASENTEKLFYQSLSEAYLKLQKL